MKLTAAQLKRLLELIAKSAASHTAEEKIELADLQAKAAASTDESSMTEADLTATVTKAVKDATAGNVTEAKVTEIVSTAVKAIKIENLDPVALASAVAEAVKKSATAGLTAEAVKAIVDQAVKGVRAPSKMEFPEESGIEFPIAHRAGNLSVSQKQLLNVLTKGGRFLGQGAIPDEVINDGIPESVLKDATDRGVRSEKRLMSSIQTKAITSGAAGSGLELMNVTLSSTLLQRLYLESKLAVALAGTEVNMPTNPFPFPLSTTRPVFQLGTSSTAATESSPGTDKLTLTAAKIMGQTNYDYEADEDSLIAVLPLITSQLGEAAAAALEFAMVSGDTTGAQDSDILALGATHVARAFNGIRKLALAQASLQLSLATGGVSAANIGALRKLLGKWGMDPKQLLIIAGPLAYNDLILLPETLTAEKAGGTQNARIFTGVAPSVFGIDIVPSAAVREDLNATGVYDGITTTKGSILIVYKPAWIAGVRRGFMLETFRDVQKQVNCVVASFRRAFAPMESLANTKAAAIGFNWTA